jgi:YggT family protein
VNSLLCTLLSLYLIVLIVRAVFSWIPVSSSGLASIRSLVLTLTEPVLAPVRQVMPRTGMFDLSFLVVVILIQVIHSAVCGGAGLF